MLRESKGWELEDIAEMTGFTYSTIHAIEKGREARTSYLVEIMRAIGVHPKELFNIPLKMTPRFPLTASRREKSRLTTRLHKVLEESDFFSEPRFTRDVAAHLKDKYRIKVKSAAVSVVLLRMVNEGRLKAKRRGRQNMYYARGRK